MTHAEVDSGVFGHGVLGTFHFGWAYTEIADTIAESVVGTETYSSVLEKSQSESLVATETIPSVLESSTTASLSASETTASVIESIHSESLEVIGCDTYAALSSGVFGAGQFGTFTFGQYYTCVPSVIESAHTSTVVVTESKSTIYEAEYTEVISPVEILESLYSMSYDEIITIIENVVAGYDWKTSCVYLTCTLDKPKSVSLHCKMKCG